MKHSSWVRNFGWRGLQEQSPTTFCLQWPRSHRDPYWQYGRALWLLCLACPIEIPCGLTPKRQKGPRRGDNMGLCPFCLSVQFLLARKSSPCESSWRGNGKQKQKMQILLGTYTQDHPSTKNKTKEFMIKFSGLRLRPCLWILLWCRNLKRASQTPLSLITMVYDFPIQDNKV